jgi:hypothetical protein
MALREVVASGGTISALQWKQEVSGKAADLDGFEETRGQC